MNIEVNPEVHEHLRQLFSPVATPADTLHERLGQMKLPCPLCVAFRAALMADELTRVPEAFEKALDDE